MLEKRLKFDEPVAERPDDVVESVVEKLRFRRERVIRPNPYVGPRALRYREHIYGRKRELLELRDLLIAERIVLLYSPSGAGKTSLIQAGLMRMMEKEEFEVLPVMRVGKSQGAALGNRYIASALLSLEENRSQAALPSDLFNTSFADGLKLLNGSDRRDSTLLIFDQFEEILTTDPLDREAKAEFFKQIGELLRDPGRWALFAIREDYVAGLDPYLRALPTRLKSTFRLDLLTVDCARRAIQEPARAFGVEFTEDATTRLVDDLRQVSVQGPSGAPEQRLGPYVEPVQLQVVCLRLWEKPRSDSAKITAEEVTATGDVDSALAEFYAERVQQVAQNSGVKERTIREWFDRALITEAGIRGEVMKGAESSDGLSNVAIQQLETAHLVRRDERRGVTWLELSHDRLVRPIRADNATWFTHNLSVLQQQATLWLRQNRSDLLCLRGDALAVAEQWATDHPEDISQREKEFLNRSRELIAAEQHARATRRLRRWTIALTVFITITSFMAFMAWWERNIARRQAKIASAGRLAALAYRLLDERLDLANLLAYEASQRMDLPETRGTLLAAVLFNPRLICFLHGHPKPIGAVAFTSDGEKLATGDFDGNVVLWDLVTHRPAQVFRKYFVRRPGQVPDAVRAIAFSGDGKYMAASSIDGRVILRDLAAERETVVFGDVGEPADTWSVAFSPDSTLLASADSKGRINVWDIVAQSSVRLPHEEAEGARSVAFSATGHYLAAGFGDGRTFVWQCQAHNDWREFDKFFVPQPPELEKQPVGRRITCVAFSPRDDNLLAFGSRDCTVNLRHVGEKRNLAQGKHTDRVTGLAFAADGSMIASVGADSLLRLWKVPSDTATAHSLEPIGQPLRGHVGWVWSVAFSPVGHRLASGGLDREAILWDTEQIRRTPAENQTFSDTTSSDFRVGLSPGGDRLVTGYNDGRIIYRDLISGKETPLPSHNKPIKSINFSRDGRFLVISSSDKSGGTITVSDTRVLDSEAAPLHFDRRIKSAAVSPDGNLVAVGLEEDGEILLWDLQSREEVGPPRKDLRQGTVYSVAFSPDGKRLAAAGDNQYALTWDLDKWKLAEEKPNKQVEEHNGTVRVAEFSPDGTILATGSIDNTVLLSDALTGRPLGPLLTGHRGPVVALAFRADGKMLASGGEDKAIVLWDVETRKQFGPRLTKHGDAVRAIKFSADGKKLISVSSPEDVITWDLDLATLSERSRDRANRNLTEAEWQAYMGGKQYRKTWQKLPTDYLVPPEN